MREHNEDTNVSSRSSFVLLRLVPEDERLETLVWFHRQKDDVEDRLGRLPIRIETTAQKNREKKLVEQKEKLEEGIKMFSRNLVGTGLQLAQEVQGSWLAI